jgi:geranylgeranyl pyrophosphate synthase
VPQIAEKPCPLQERLCYCLVADVLREIDFHLLEIKSVRFLSDYPWKSGKRLRPITFLLSYLSVLVQRTTQFHMNGRESRLAAAIEILHEASLVHDDLVDRSTVRRGKPSMHVLHGDGLALLIGDYMVFRGLKLILDAAASREDVLLAQELANTGLAIAQGEADQLDRYLKRFEPEARMSMDSYVGVIANKTAAFFAGCAEVGAAMGGADRSLRTVYRSFGMSMGLAFQMLDDVMDIFGDPEQAAKTLGNNIAEGTVTLPMIHAFRLFPDDPLMRKLANGDPMNSREQAGAHRVFARPEVIEASQATIDEYAKQAQEHLARMPRSIYRTGLSDLLDYVLCCPWGGLKGQFATPPPAAIHFQQNPS